MRTAANAGHAALPRLTSRGTYPHSATKGHPLPAITPTLPAPSPSLPAPALKCLPRRTGYLRMCLLSAVIASFLANHIFNSRAFQHHGDTSGPSHPSLPPCPHPHSPSPRRPCLHPWPPELHALSTAYLGIFLRSQLEVIPSFLVNHTSKSFSTPSKKCVLLSPIMVARLWDIARRRRRHSTARHSTHVHSPAGGPLH